MATVIAPLRSDPTLKNELEWFLGHWSPLQGAEVTAGIRIKLQWSQIQDFIGFVFVQRRYTNSRDYSSTNNITRWSALRCERRKALRKGDSSTVSRKFREKDAEMLIIETTRLRFAAGTYKCFIAWCHIWYVCGSGCNLYRITRSEKQDDTDGTIGSVISCGIIHGGLQAASPCTKTYHSSASSETQSI